MKSGGESESREFTYRGNPPRQAAVSVIPMG